MADVGSSFHSRSQDEIFRGLYRQLRRHLPDIPESPDRIDPMLRVLMHVFAGQLHTIEDHVEGLWDDVSRAVQETICPEVSRWPIPAATVMRAELNDPIVDIDSDTVWSYREERSSGRNFLFAATAPQRLARIEIAEAHLVCGDRVVRSTVDQTLAAEADGPLQLYVGLTYDGPPSALAGTHLYLKAANEATELLRWGRWITSREGRFVGTSGFIPGALSAVATLMGISEDQDLGGLRTIDELYADVVRPFVVWPEHATRDWRPESMPAAISRPLRRARLQTKEEERFWVAIDLPEAATIASVWPVGEWFGGATLAINRTALSLLKHTGGSRIVDVTLPEPYETIFAVDRVVDAFGNEYRLRQAVSDAAAAYVYVGREHDGRLRIWLEIPESVDGVPDTVSVYYSTTTGAAANAIDAGQIVQPYAPHPGIASAVNVVATSGGIPARTRDQVTHEVAQRLRMRDRALSQTDIEQWARGFDPRILNVVARSAVLRRPRGLARGVQVTLTVNGELFTGDTELDVLRHRVHRFLNARATINTPFEVTVERN